MIRTSESVVKIAAALLVVKSKIGDVKKSADNPYFKSKYADLNSVLDAVEPELNANGILVLQFPDDGDTGDVLALTTRLQHSSGEFMEATASIPLAKSDPQAFGAAVTYGRRYGLQSIMALQAVDDDAESAVAHGANSTGLPATKAPAPKPGGFKLGGGKAPATTAPKRGKTGVFPKTESE